MSHDVFISHSSADKRAADAACAVLEARGIKCWIAPRDIRPGSDWGESIITAIERTRIMLLLLSRQANSSPQIRREVERAVNRSIIIIPVRLENVMPGRSLEFFLSTSHWMDAFPPPFENHLENLARTIHQIVFGSQVPFSQTKIPVAPWWQRHGLALLLAAVGLYGVRAYSVSRRIPDIGILVALGADRGMITKMILRETGWLALFGVSIGLAMAYVLARYIESMLYGVAAHDLTTFAGASIILIIVAAVSGYLPARRAARIDPLVALRHD